MSFSKVRNAHKTENTEDYLELIAELLNSKGEARIVDIAESLGMHKPQPIKQYKDYKHRVTLKENLIDQFF